MLNRGDRGGAYCGVESEEGGGGQDNYEKIQESQHLKVSSSKGKKYDGVLCSSLAPRGVWFIGSYWKGDLIKKVILLQV